MASDIYFFRIIMSAVFTGYPPYHDIPHDHNLIIKIYNGYRPKIRCKVPQLLLDLMKKCLDRDPQSRPTAKALVHELIQFYKDLKNKETELYEQAEEIENSICDQADQTLLEQHFFTSCSLPSPLYSLPLPLLSLSLSLSQ
ncbi:hypothetical protein C2G38_2111672 [Gigaspora rosea]|uniref:Protein kinase domain-containing protein n=1 Tax=Gigaspora rosea TaxID=44941 RepID=A0A397UGM2_9GLOM|nr:hypothetical protein C2G38_2111672 [Gigaspora rosea]